MSKLWDTPVDVQYKVNFYSGGDTTRNAFGKHINEFIRIYGLLNALDAAKVSASDIGSIGSSITNITTDLQNHINSSNPHPNYKPSWNDLTNKPNLSDLNGNLDVNRINGLTSKINSLLPAPSGDGIISDSLNANGYVKFKNGLIVQWGVHTREDAGDKWEHTVSFPIPFPNACYNVVITCYPKSTGGPVRWGDDNEFECYLNNWNNNGFNALAHVEDLGSTSISYIAIGK